MLGLIADCFVLQRQRDTEQEHLVASSHSTKNGGGSSCWTTHGGDNHIGIQNQSHIIYDISLCRNVSRFRRLRWERPSATACQSRVHQGRRRKTSIRILARSN